MKHFLIAILLAGLVGVSSPHDPVVPKYYLERKGDTIRIYEPGKPITPKWIIKDIKVYKPESFIPVFELKEDRLNNGKTPSILNDLD